MKLDLTRAFPLVLAACGSASVPPNEEARVSACPTSAVGVVASASGSASVRTPPPPVSIASPSAPPTPDEYADCKAIRRADDLGSATLDVAAARASGWLWPAKCGKVLGWLGVGMVRAAQATGFATDGKRFVSCGAWEAGCDVLDLGRDLVTERVTSAWPDGPDGTPITSTPPVKKLFQRLGAPAPQGHFPYSDDLRVSWAVGDGGHSLYVSLILLANGSERVIHRFPSRADASLQPIVLEGVTLSPDGGVLELDAFAAQGGMGFDVALVNLHAEAAALFRTAGDAFADKAKHAESLAHTAAPSFIE